MKHMLRLSFLAAFLVVLSGTSSAFVNPAFVSKPVPNSETVAKPSPFAGMTVKEFLALTPKKYRELTGQRMKLSQKISLKIAQYKLKKMMKKNKNVDMYSFAPQGIDTTDFSIGGLVLGLLLGIIGVLIAYLIGDSAVIKWAWIGFAIWVGIVLLVLIL